jgi:hypothetical protein
MPVTGADGDPFETRFARKFGIVLVGALFAAEAGAAPWNEAFARKAIRKLYRGARRRIRNAAEETDAFLSALRENHEKGRFPLIKKGQAEAEFDRDRDWGVRRKIGKVWIIGMRMEMITEIVRGASGARGGFDPEGTRSAAFAAGR